MMPFWNACKDFVFQYFQMIDRQKLKTNVRHCYDPDQTCQKNVSVDTDVVALKNRSRLQVDWGAWIDLQYSAVC